MLVTFGICLKQHFDTRYLVFYNISPPGMFLSLDLLSEYRSQHGAIGPLYVTSSCSTWIFCRGVSGFATDCPSGVWCRGLTNCLLHVGPPFDICNYICLDTSYHFRLDLYFLNIVLYFSSTPVLTVSMDVAFILSIRKRSPMCVMISKVNYCVSNNHL